MRWTDSRMFYVNARAEGPSLVLNLDTGSEASRFHTKVRWPRGRVAGHTGGAASDSFGTESCASIGAEPCP